MERSDYKILIVEDTVEFAKLTLLTLNRVGLQAEHAKNGNEAIDYLDRQKPDVVVLDLNLPGVSGWQVLQHLQTKYGEGTIPVIITSAYSDGANRLIGKLQDVSRYLIKPFPPAELIRSVEEALGLIPPEA